MQSVKKSLICQVVSLMRVYIPSIQPRYQFFLPWHKILIFIKVLIPLVLMKRNMTIVMQIGVIYR